MKSFIAATGESRGAWSETVSFCGATPAGSVSMTGAGAPEIYELPLDTLRKGLPIARNLDTEFGCQRDDLA